MTDTTTTPTLTGPAAEIAERVARGVAWLDEHDPTWWRADATPVSSMHDSEPIELDRLDISDPCGCVLGHRWGHFGHAMIDAPYFGRRPAALGFDAYENAEYGGLTAEWRRVIRARRAEVTGDG